MQVCHHLRKFSKIIDYNDGFINKRSCKQHKRELVSSCNPTSLCLGSRYDEEKYICRLFDSILRKYPIGLLILWNPEKLVAFRRFIDEYEDNNSFKPKDE